MKIHIFQHVHFEGPGYILNWAHARKHEVNYTKFYHEDYILPHQDSVDVLVVLGGPMSVHDEEKHPWLRIEKAFIQHFISTGKKVMGICLGAQLLALCLGASVGPADNTEIGWHQVYPDAEEPRAHWLKKIFTQQPVVFHWHGEQFWTPQGCSAALISRANKNQAFLYQNVLGLQFHPEATQDNIDLMMENSREHLTEREFIQNRMQIEKGFGHIPGQNSIMKDILDRFFKDSDEHD